MFKGLERVTYQLGETIFLEGEDANCAYLIERGRVEISVATGKKFIPVRELGAGDLFGEMGFFEKHRRIARAIALEQTRLVKIDRALIKSKLSKTDPVIQELLVLILKRLRTIHYKFTSKHDNA